LGGVHPFAEELPDGIWDGEVLDGKYRFEQPLASSSMAIVVIARHLELDERVAIKFLSPNAIRTSGALARFRREWRRIRTEAPRDLKRLRPECPSELIEVVAKCLQEEPSKRFSDLGGFATALAPIAPERSRSSIARIQWVVISPQTGSTCPSAPAVECEPVKCEGERRSRRRLITAGAVAAMMLALGNAAAHVTSSPEAQSPRSEPPATVQVAPTSDTLQVAAASPTEPASSRDVADDTSSAEHRRWLVPPVGKCL
jgi:hypothetical protein